MNRPFHQSKSTKDLMKSLRFLYAFTVLLTNNIVNANESSQTSQTHSQPKQQTSEEVHRPTPFELINILIDTLEHDVTQETSVKKDFDFFQHQQNEVKKLVQKMNDTNKLVIKNIEDEKFNTEKKYQQLVSQATTDNKNELNQAEESYKKSLAAHSASLQKMTIDDQGIAVDTFKATTVVEFKITMTMLKEKLATKLQQLADDHVCNLQNIEKKQEIIQQKYNETTDRYYKMVSVLNEEEGKALVEAQIEHIQRLEQREFDETYSTATHPSVWSGMGSIAGSTPYSYRANENGFTCEGCIQPNGAFIDSNLKKEMEASQSPEAAQSLAMVVWALKKEQAQEGHSYKIGIQNCRLESNKLNCKIIKEAYEKALEERKQRAESKEIAN